MRQAGAGRGNIGDLALGEAVGIIECQITEDLIGET